MRVTNVANAVIVNTHGQILLTQRHDPKNTSIHLKWQVPGGKIEKNEKPIDACIREAREETGLYVKALSESPIVVEQEYENVKFYLNVFLTSPISDTIDTSLDEETADAKWYDFANIQNLSTLDNTLEMIEKALKLWKKS